MVRFGEQKLLYKRISLVKRKEGRREGVKKGKKEGGGGRNPTNREVAGSPGKGDLLPSCKRGGAASAGLKESGQPGGLSSSDLPTQISPNRGSGSAPLQ